MGYRRFLTHSSAEACHKKPKASQGEEIGGRPTFWVRVAHSRPVSISSEVTQYFWLDLDRSIRNCTLCFKCKLNWIIQWSQDVLDANFVSAMLSSTNLIFKILARKKSFCTNILLIIAFINYWSEIVRNGPEADVNICFN